MSLRSPLGRVLGLGSAKGGSAHWYAQRVTAVALVLLGGWFVAALGSLDNVSHAAIVTWLAAPAASVLAVLFVAVSAYHANLGLQVVVEDYVANQGTRVAVLVAIRFALVAGAVTGMLAVLRIAVGVHA
jgi:succinate dehydrogenase / fumarate reductase membrane anchor subunit